MINQKSANIQECKVLKSGVVLYTIASDSSDYTYYVTVTNGKIDEATHQDCKGFHFCGKCFHVKDIYAMEGEIQAERKMAAYLNTYDDMAAEKVQSIEAVKAAYAQAQTSGLAGSYKASWYPNTAA